MTAQLITLPREVVEQLVDALEYWGVRDPYNKETAAAITAGRSALANAEQTDMQAERIEELEQDRLQLYCANETLAKNNAALRAQLAEIAATEPVGYANAARLSCIAERPAHIYQKELIAAHTPLFTRPMPAQDVPETNFGNTNDPLYWVELSCANYAAQFGESTTADWIYNDLRECFVGNEALQSAQPVAAQPLTDEQIDDVTNAQWGRQKVTAMYFAYRAYARAIEAAHGITEQVREA